MSPLVLLPAEADPVPEERRGKRNLDRPRSSCKQLNLITLLGWGGGGMLSVNGRNSGYRSTRRGRESVRDRSGWSRAKSCDDVCKSCDEVCPRVDRKRSPAMMFASPAMRFYPRVDRERSPAMMIVQGWIASEVLRWWLPKGGSRAKSCDDDCPRVDRKRSPAMMFTSPAMGFTQGWIAGWLRDNCATLLNQDRSATGIMAVQGTVKGGLC